MLEDLTLRIDQITPSDIAKRFCEKGIQAAIVMITYLEVAFMIVVVFAIQAATGSTERAFGPGGYKIQLLAFLIMGGTLLVGWRWPLPTIMKWMLGNGERKSIKWRFLALMFIGFASMFLYDELLDRALGVRGPSLNANDNRRYLYAYLPFVPIHTLFFVSIQGTAMVLMPLNHPFLKLFKALLWRIVEYEKGAIAAIVLCATVLLTIVKLILMR